MVSNRISIRFAFYEISHKYTFISQENLNTFLAKLKAYMPQYGGYCAYTVAIDSKKVSIDPETFEIRDGKLYLFYNSWGNNTLKDGREKM
ncbi:YHS domain-containing (seleno)protein [Winogradskyella schleiferi]|uniref:YHS domain-containing (seleno)protein n=1 Tax=Winogradskyella schleiferi TaxID=2686078 RepID=UPI00293BF872|nr:YHS domain-containing (seleno)protein [Winogradskyella schleiferi]